MSNEFTGYASHTDKEIKGFFGRYRIFSNYEPSPISYRGYVFCSVENAFQASKVLGTDGVGLFEEFVFMTPQRSKRLGRKVKVRSDWEDVKYNIMRDLVYKKFETHQDLLDILIATKDKYLEETNHWNDTYYGVNYKTGEGQNNLGKILMSVRAEFQGYASDQLELFI
jgi:ribA/ribD-fused uncharacterized protein